MESTIIINGPKISRIKLVFSLLFVPGVYLMILFSNVLTIVIGWLLIEFIKNLLAKLFVGIQFGIFGFYLLIGFVVSGMLFGLIGSFLAILSTIFNKKNEEPAILITINEHPKLYHLIVDLSEKMNTKIPDSIILHAKSSFFVTNRKIKVFNGIAKGRVLSISMPLLNVLTVNELRSILAHEFAHFTGRDKIYTKAVLPVYRVAINYFENIKSVFYYNGSNLGLISIPLIIPNKLMKCYLKSFQKLNMNISREREFRADYIATEICGYDTFKSALSKIVSYSEFCDDLIDRQIGEKLIAGYVYKNYFLDYRQNIEKYKKHTQKYFDKALLENSYSSHPPFLKRIAKIPFIEEQYFDHDKSILLINELEGIEINLTQSYNNFIYKLEMRYS